MMPVKRLRAGINLVNTKGNKYFRLVSGNPRIQIPHEFIKEAHYRVYATNGHPEAMADLESHLRNGTNIYTPSLGLAQCLADVSFINAIEAVRLEQGVHKLSCVIPVDQTKKIHYELEGRYSIFRVPSRMNPERVVTCYSEVVVDEEIGKISAETSNAFNIGGTNVVFF